MESLRVYRDHVNANGGILSVETLVREGLTRNHAQVVLHRLRKGGHAIAMGHNQVRLLKPGEPRPAATVAEWTAILETRFRAKPTGHSVLAKRYLVGKPTEFVLPRSKLKAAAENLRRTHSELRVAVDEFQPGANTVCLWPGKVRGDQASTEDALVHLYRHAPREEFALALQATLMAGTELNWTRLRRKPEWHELAGIFVFVNEKAGRKVFPAFRSTEAPDLSLNQLLTIAQPFTARGVAS